MNGLGAARPRQAAALARPAVALARPAWLGWALTGFALACAWRLLSTWTPAGDPAHAVCAMRQLFHVDCPTCGFTRALTELARGRLGASLGLHPMALPVVGEVVAAWLLWSVALVRGAPILRERWIPAIVGANAVAFAATWLVRLLIGTLP